jgi:hypothetical protein
MVRPEGIGLSDAQRQTSVCVRIIHSAITLLRPEDDSVCDTEFRSVQKSDIRLIESCVLQLVEELPAERLKDEDARRVERVTVHFGVQVMDDLSLGRYRGPEKVCLLRRHERRCEQRLAPGASMRWISASARW